MTSQALSPSSQAAPDPPQPKPDPPENPLRLLRFDQRLSLDQLARKAGVSRQLIIRAEQAVYNSPPPVLVATLLDNISEDRAVEGFDDREFVYHLYKQFQTFTRKKNYGRLNPKFSFAAVPVGVHPWVNWRLSSGIAARIGPAKHYCVHPALLHKFEVQPHLVQSPPGDLRGALIEAGYRKELLDELAAAYDTYKVHLSEQFKLNQKR